MLIRAMKVTARFFGDLIPLLGRESTLDLEEGASVNALVRLLSSRIGCKRPGYVGSYRVGGGDLVILVNGRNIDTLERLETRLKDGDVVTLLPPFSGG